MWQEETEWVKINQFRKLFTLSSLQVPSRSQYGCRFNTSERWSHKLQSLKSLLTGFSWSWSSYGLGKMLFWRLWSVDFCRHKLLSSLQKESSEVAARVYGRRFDSRWRWFVKWRAAFVWRRKFDCNFCFWNQESSSYQRSKRHKRCHLFKMPQFFPNQVQLWDVTSGRSLIATRSFRGALFKPSLGLKKKTAGFRRHNTPEWCWRGGTIPLFILEDLQMNDLRKLLFWI